VLALRLLDGPFPMVPILIPPVQPRSRSTFLACSHRDAREGTSADGVNEACVLSFGPTKVDSGWARAS